VAEARPGLGDSAVLELARQQKRILMTADKDFAELVFKQRAASCGVILLRLRHWNASRRLQRMVEVLRVEVPAADGLMVVEPTRIRHRSFGPG
jgi:predicted nuclease of predicted toxin-antitoxin system